MEVSELRLISYIFENCKGVWLWFVSSKGHKNKNNNKVYYLSVMFGEILFLITKNV